MGKRLRSRQRKSHNARPYDPQNQSCDYEVYSNVDSLSNPFQSLSLSSLSSENVKENINGTTTVASNPPVFSSFQSSQSVNPNFGFSNQTAGSAAFGTFTKVFSNNEALRSTFQNGGSCFRSMPSRFAFGAKNKNANFSFSNKTDSTSFKSAHNNTASVFKSSSSKVAFGAKIENTNFLFNREINSTVFKSTSNINTASAFQSTSSKLAFAAKNKYFSFSKENSSTVFKSAATSSNKRASIFGAENETTNFYISISPAALKYRGTTELEVFSGSPFGMSATIKRTPDEVFVSFGF